MAPAHWPVRPVRAPLGNARWCSGSRPRPAGPHRFRPAYAAVLRCRFSAHIPGSTSWTLLLADAYPSSEIVGFDAHDGSIQAARKRAADAGLTDRVSFEVASATTFGGTVEQKRGVH
jgi:hypothetical protein